MKKYLILLITLFLPLVSACNVITGGNDGRVELSVLNFRPEDQDFYEWMIDEFEKEYPNIRVIYEAVDTGNYATLLNSRFIINEVDVYGIQPGASLSGAVSLARSYPLNDLNIWDDVTDVAKNEITFDGNQLIAPLTSVSNVVYFKVDYFRDNNLNVPTTWQEFIDVLEFMKNDSSVVAPIVFGGRELWPMAMIISQLETTIVRPAYPNIVQDIVHNDLKLENTPEFMLMLERLNILTNYFQPGSAGFDYALAPGQFASRNYPLMIDGSWSLSAIREANPNAEIGIFLLPGNDDPEKNVYHPGKVGAGWSIAPSSRNKDAAKKFIEFQFRPEVYTRYINETMQAPTIRGINLEDHLARELSMLPMQLVLENMWVPRMRVDTYLKNNVGPGFINKSLTPQQAARAMDKMLQDDKPIWRNEVDNWSIRFPQP